MAHLESALEFLREEVTPNAQALDQSEDALRTALNGLCERGLMALRRPTKYGGPALDETDFRRFQEECARASGTLAFLQTQHQSAVSMISKSDNEALKQQTLPKMADGGRLMGIGFSQLRRSGPPAMRATPTEGGYRLDGEVPWITGWNFFPQFLVGATLGDGQAVFGIAPLVGTAGIALSEPMRLAAMETANTVSAKFENYFLSDELVAFIRPAGWIRNNDQINIALQGHFSIGCASAGLDVLKAAADKRNLDFLHRTHEALADELARCRRATAEAKAGAGEESTMERLEIRAWAIELMVRCAHAAVTASSGAANSLAHPAQRIYREALVFTVSAQTTEIMEATLNRLVRTG